MVDQSKALKPVSLIVERDGTEGTLQQLHDHGWWSTCGWLLHEDYGVTWLPFDVAIERAFRTWA